MGNFIALHALLCFKTHFNYKNTLNSLDKKRSIFILIFGALLIMLPTKSIWAQITTQKDTIYVNDESFESLMKISAKDSIFNHLKNKQIELFGDATLDYMEIKLTANYMLIDLNKKEVFASYTFDADSNRIGMPVFTDGAETVDAASMRFNFETKKGYIQEVKIKQDENYLYMGVAKRQANEEVHFKQGRFTTCDLEEPHFHFQLSRAILIPEKRIVSGPMNLWIKGVPTPLGLPFIFIPQKKPEQRNHGFLFPQFVPMGQFGMGIQELGYYLPINDSLHTTFYGSVYSRGTWGVGNRTQYKIKYKFEGNLETRYEYFDRGFPFPDSTNPRKFTLIWNHRQDPKANPIWNFSSNVNFQSDNNPKINTNNQDMTYLSNSFNSDINLTRNFPGKPITMGLKSSFRQNSNSKNFQTSLPVFNANVTRFFPLKRLTTPSVGKQSAAQRFLSQIGMTYNLEAQNAGTFGDSLIRLREFEKIQHGFMQGVRQNTTIQTTIGLFNETWKLTPSVNYSNQVNFQQIRKSYNAATNSTKTDTIQQIGMSQNMSLNASLTTVVYSYYRFVGKNKPLLRHILTPSFGYRYVPVLNQLITTNAGPNLDTITYSPFENSIYRDGSTQAAGLITFGFNNTFELKRKSDKDTITGFKKTRIIDALSVTGNYNHLKDSMQLSDINVSLRISPVDFFNFVSNATISPYAWTDSTGKTLGQYAVLNNQGLGRILNLNFNSNFTLAPKKSRGKIQENKQNFLDNWNADYTYFAMHPEQFIDFEIPWKVTFTHVWSISANQQKTIVNPDQFLQTQSINMSGDISLTKRWKIIGDINIDVPTKQITYSQFNLTRNMHCWNLSFFWRPIGTNQSFSFRLNATSSLFQSAKIEIRQPPQLF